MWRILPVVHSEMAPFSPELRFYIFEILEIVYYSCGFKNVHALFRTKNHHLRMDTISLKSRNISKNSKALKKLKGEAMKRNLFCFILISAVAVGLLGCGDKYSSAVDVNNKFAAATEEYIEALGKCDSSESAASAIDTYAAKMEKIGPKIKEIAEKYPELRGSTEISKELQQSREKVAAVTAKMGPAMMNMMKYMGDPKVMEAQQRFQKAMASMAPQQN